jgi:deazaflavin-dependent oxidoreductase (nitroreductase family)
VAVVVHCGRRSGRRYRTPVLAYRLDDGYLIALFYGAGSDWARNVLAAGSCTLERGGRQVQLADPRTLDAGEGRALVPALMRPALRLLRVTHLLRLSATQRPGHRRCPTDCLMHHRPVTGQQWRRALPVLP